MKGRENYTHRTHTPEDWVFSQRVFVGNVTDEGPVVRVIGEVPTPMLGTQNISHRGHRDMVQGEAKLSWSSPGLNSVQLKAKCWGNSAFLTVSSLGMSRSHQLHSDKQKESRNESPWQTGCTKARWVCSTRCLIIAEGEDRASSGVLVQVSGLSKIGQRVSCEAPPRWQCQRNPKSRQLGTQPDAESAPGSFCSLLLG